MSFDPGLTTGPFNLVWIDREGREDDLVGTAVAPMSTEATDELFATEVTREIHSVARTSLRTR